MKHMYKKLKKGILVFMLLLCMAFVTQQTVVTTYAYTQEEIDAAKAWLSAHGYSPDAGGAYAAYADYMNGKFGAIPGLPEPNVKPDQPAQEDTSDDGMEVVESETEGSDEDEPSEGDDKQPEGGSATQQQPEVPTDAVGTDTEQPQLPDIDAEQAAEELKELVESADLPEELPELELPTPSQQEFADMIDVFVSEFSEDEQAEINKAKERLERQKQERAAAEKEAERIQQAEHAPQKNVIIILCAVLVAAVLGLGIVIVKKNRES